VKILAMDIGAGTQDILLYDSATKLENCAKLVLPSPNRRLAKQVEKAGVAGKDLFITGYTVGGGPFAKAVRRHLSSGRRALMTTAAAFSIRNNLVDLANLGIEIVESPPADFDGVVIQTDELDLSPLRNLFESAGASLDGLAAAAVAVQDHGTYAGGESNRKTRLRHMRRRLEENPDPLALAYPAEEIPHTFPRLSSAASRLREQLSCEHILVMDTSPAAVAGCLADPHVASQKSGNLLLINAGNGHTLACLLSDGRVTALLEHHTRKLRPDAFASYLSSFCEGKARDDDPFMASGHGLFYLDEPSGTRNLDLVAVTGPNRELMRESGLEIYYPAPGGDMMMTGPMGLVMAVLRHMGSEPGSGLE